MMGTILMRGWFRSCYHLNCEIIWRLRRTNRELCVARLNLSEAEILLKRLSCLIRLGSWRWWLITTWALVIWAELGQRFKWCWRRKLRSMGSLVLSFRWDGRYLGGWCSFFVDFGEFGVCGASWGGAMNRICVCGVSWGSTMNRKSICGVSCASTMNLKSICGTSSRCSTPFFDLMKKSHPVGCVAV